MKSLTLPAVLATALFALISPAIAQYADGQDATPEQAQAYQDAQGCILVLKAAGGDDNLQMAEQAMAKAKELAPINGDDTDEKFAKSMKDWEEILGLASVDESKQFLANCRETWSA
ncbi:MAG: hypothetical protein EOP62_17070 [Sphingomonadales bacterium]|nr:MAG: hypothetical protein EOP62_17070 [Sphingomonadales bacterium]